MRVFIGSSSKAEQEGDLQLVTEELRQAFLIPEPWSSPETFAVGTELWTSLLNKTLDVDAAAFIFREDDQLQTLGATTATIRDNVLLEFGLFSGVLFSRFRRENANCAIFKRGSPKIPTDLSSVTCISLDDTTNLRSKVQAWADLLRRPLKKRAVLECDQLNEIIRAMFKSRVAIEDIYDLMARLDVLPAEVEAALSSLRSSRRTKEAKPQLPPKGTGSRAK